MRRAVLMAALLAGGCGGDGDPFAGARPIGTGPGFAPGSLSRAVAAGRPVGDLRSPEPPRAPATT